MSRKEPSASSRYRQCPLRWRLARSLITVCWFRFLNRLDLSLKRVKPCDCARNADQVECLFGPLNLSFDGRSLSRPSPHSFKLQDPGPNRPADVGAAAECKQQCQGRVYHGRTPAPGLTTLITRWNPYGFDCHSAARASSNAALVVFAKGVHEQPPADPRQPDSAAHSPPSRKLSGKGISRAEPLAS